MRVWVTRYALTQGILEIEGEDCGDSMFHYPGNHMDRYDQYYHGQGENWHLTRESAVKRAEEMRVAKIASLQKQIEKLKKVSF